MVGCGGGGTAPSPVKIFFKNLYSSIASRQPVVEPALFTALTVHRWICGLVAQRTRWPEPTEAPPVDWTASLKPQGEDSWKLFTACQLSLSSLSAKLDHHLLDHELHILDRGLVDHRSRIANPPVALTTAVHVNGTPAAHLYSAGVALTCTIVTILVGLHWICWMLYSRWPVSTIYVIAVNNSKQLLSKL